MGKTKILEVSFIDQDPNKVQFVLDNLAEAYLQYSLDEKRLAVRQGIGFVDEQLPALHTRVDKLEGRVQEFRQEYNLLDPDKQSEILAEQKS